MTITKTRHLPASEPKAVIHVAEKGTRTPRGVLRCEIGTNVTFSTTSLESYFFAGWERVAYDALLVAAAVEFADKTHRRAAFRWERDIVLRVPVHDVTRWRNRHVEAALLDALTFLTGDRWHLEFYQRRRPENPSQQVSLSLPPGLDAVLPFSNGLDSRAVAGLMTREMGTRLVRIRLGSLSSDREALARERQPFTSVPYKVKTATGSCVESSARSRGFKFALVSGIAAYLAKAGQVIVPESGQGALGPTLVTVGQAYEDYRSHPLFTGRMETLIEALFGHRVRYSFPQLWNTKGETLRRFVQECGDASWASTWSCWRQNRHVSVDGKRRQCGVCAACMLRRMSVHAAGLSELGQPYVWANLSAPTFEAGAAASYRAKGKITTASREYAIAGALHLDHLAGLLGGRTHSRALDLVAFQLGGALGLGQTDARTRLERLLEQHRVEWEAFMVSLGPHSFVADWALWGRA